MIHGTRPSASRCTGRGAEARPVVRAPHCGVRGWLPAPTIVHQQVMGERLTARIGPEPLEGGQQGRGLVGADGPLDAPAIPDALRLLLPTNVAATAPSADQKR